MCLNKAKKLNIVHDGTEIDRTCYKVLLVKGKWPFRKLHSPLWDDFTWKKNKMYSATACEEPDRTRIGDDKWEVDGRSFHSFMNLLDACFVAEEIKKNKQEDYRVYECIIPKDTRFVYEGEYGCGYGSYASEKLIVKKQVYKAKGKKVLNIRFF